MSPIRIVIGDDHQLVREGIRQVLSGTDEFEVVGEAGSGAALLRLVDAVKPDLALLDISMPELSGIEVAGVLHRDHPSVRMLMLSVHDHPQYVVESVRAGAHGYLRKDTDPAQLRGAIRAIARGESYFGPEAAKHLSAVLRNDGETTSAARRLGLLTRRERQVLEGIASGATNKEIAAQLGLSHRTVESYRESLMRKLEIYTVAGLTRFAIDAAGSNP